MDDPAGGPVGRVFPELAFSVPAFRNNYFTGERLSDYPDGVPDFWLWILPLGNMWQQDVPLIEFSEGWDWAKAQMQKDVCQNFKMMEKIFLMPYRKNASGLFSIFHFPFS